MGERLPDPMLPYESGPVREVSWFKVTQTEKKRRFLRNKILTDLIIDPKTGMAASHDIQSADISKIQDPDLRYALRLADAAQAVGNHMVSIEATDEGVNSQFVRAEYTGTLDGGADTFMQDLRRLAPLPDVPGMAAVLVPGKNGNPDTRFWVSSR